MKFIPILWPTFRWGFLFILLLGGQFTLSTQLIKPNIPNSARFMQGNRSYEKRKHVPYFYRVMTRYKDNIFSISFRNKKHVYFDHRNISSLCSSHHLYVITSCYFYVSIELHVRDFNQSAHAHIFFGLFFKLQIMHGQLLVFSVTPYQNKIKLFNRLSPEILVRTWNLSNKDNFDRDDVDNDSDFPYATENCSTPEEILSFVLS